MCCKGSKIFGKVSSNKKRDLDGLNGYYLIRKKFRGVFNFVFFADDKDPRIFSIK